MKLPRFSLRDLFWPVLVVIASLSPAHSGEFGRIYHFSFGDQGEFALIDGKPVLARIGAEIDDRKRREIRVQKDGSLIHVATGKTLGYPLDGDDPTVSLGGERGTSDKWTFDFGLKDDSESVVRAASGKFKGWYLDWDEEREVIVRDKAYYVRSLKLVKSPVTKRKFSRSRLRI
jgi:hypothetical protein